MIKFTFNDSEMDWTYTAEIEDISIDGYDLSISEARVEGRIATDEELDQMNDDGEFHYDQVMKSAY